MSLCIRFRAGRYGPKITSWYIQAEQQHMVYASLFYMTWAKGSAVSQSYIRDVMSTFVKTDCD